MKNHLTREDRSVSWLNMKPKSEVSDTFTLDIYQGLFTWGYIDQSLLTQDEWVALFDMVLQGEPRIFACLPTYGSWLALLAYARVDSSRVYAPRPAVRVTPTRHLLRRAVAECNVELRGIAPLRDACFSLENALLYGEEHERQYVREWISRVCPSPNSE